MNVIKCFVLLNAEFISSGELHVSAGVPAKVGNCFLCWNVLSQEKQFGFLSKGSFHFKTALSAAQENRRKR